MRLARYEGVSLVVETGRALGRFFILLLASILASLSCSEGSRQAGQGRAVSRDDFCNLGRVLALGPAAESMHKQGTQVVLASRLPGAAEALEMRRAAKLAAILDREGIIKIVVDPSIAVRAPLPRDDVRTRLALLRSLSQYGAKVITKDLVLYERAGPRPDRRGVAKTGSPSSVSRPWDSGPSRFPQRG